ncbi:hypothetical protein O3M35_005627 [Rhynocoris fuscipes]|uniref:Uncharacterized protein n=1 Tax=Rhynocoris fuscipes TaxID=488301 RepID=A0AAW1DRD3_9HEMI
MGTSTTGFLQHSYWLSLYFSLIFTDPYYIVSRKQCILSESRFDFLRDLVKSVPEVATSDDDNWVPGDGQANDNSSSTSHSTRRNSTNEMAKESNEVATTGANFYMETEMNSGAQSDSNDSDSKSSESDRSKELHIDDNTNQIVSKSDEDDYDT